jgi:hypothetical protein
MERVSQALHMFTTIISFEKNERRKKEKPVQMDPSTNFQIS